MGSCVHPHHIHLLPTPPCTPSTPSLTDLLVGFQVYVETYSNSMQGVRAPVQAALTQMLSNFVETLREIEDKVVRWVLSDVELEQQ